MQIKNNQLKESTEIIREAAKWLINNKNEMWKLEEITEEKIEKSYKKEDIYVGYINNEPAITFILQWEDNEFWPNIPNNTSAFLHKIAISRKYSGNNLLKMALIEIENICKNKDVYEIRLDCDPNRIKLCNVYENLGFIRVDKKRLNNKIDVAYYKKEIINGA